MYCKTKNNIIKAKGYVRIIEQYIFSFTNVLKVWYQGHDIVRGLLLNFDLMREQELYKGEMECNGFMQNTEITQANSQLRLLVLHSLHISVGPATSLPFLLLINYSSLTSSQTAVFREQYTVFVLTIYLLQCPMYLIY